MAIAKDITLPNLNENLETEVGRERTISDPATVMQEVSLDAEVSSIGAS
jgi:hypothetical protein